MEINININLNQAIFMVKPNTTRATRTKKFQGNPSRIAIINMSQGTLNSRVLQPIRLNTILRKFNLRDHPLVTTMREGRCLLRVKPYTIPNISLISWKKTNQGINVSTHTTHEIANSRVRAIISMYIYDRV